MLGRLSAGGRLRLEEVHRFPSVVVRLPPGPSLRWDVLNIYAQLAEGLRKAACAAGPGGIEGVSVDSWGVDYVLIGGRQPMLWPPFHYRDERNAESSRRVRARLGDAEIFARTGVQFLPFNTIYQLAADLESNGELLAQADAFLTIGDYFNYLFSGVARIDESNASTTQLYNPRSRQWSRDLIDQCGLPPHLFPTIVPPGTVLGPLRPEVAGDTGFGAMVPQVIATCSHDTGAAVAAVPTAGGDDWAYLSSGTWSLLGVELTAPLIDDRARVANFTNEAGFNGTTQFLKNLVGLWILQELRRAWAIEGDNVDYAKLNELARSAEPFRSLIDPDDARFATPGDMPAKVVAFCRETGQPSPQTPGQFARCVLESLALLYRATIEEIESLTGRRIRTLHVVGGGSQSDLLNQLTVDATGRALIAGPAEASAIGNVLVQAVALGHVASLADLREIVRESFPATRYAPSADPRWGAAYDRFVKLRNAVKSRDAS